MSVSFADVIIEAGKARVEREARYRQARHERWLELKEAAEQADNESGQMRWADYLPLLIQCRDRGLSRAAIADRLSQASGRQVTVVMVDSAIKHYGLRISFG